MKAIGRAIPFLLPWAMTASAARAQAVDDGYVLQRRFGMEPVFAVAAGQPQGLSVAAGVVVGSSPVPPVKCAFGYSTEGMLVQVEPGIGGGKLSLGAARANGVGGVGAKASLLRTWGKPWGTRPGTTYVGGELVLAAFVRTNVGILRRVGQGPGDRTLFTWSVGLGF
jgi:hypothetical protein